MKIIVSSLLFALLICLSRALPVVSNDKNVFNDYVSKIKEDRVIHTEQGDIQIDKALGEGAAGVAFSTADGKSVVKVFNGTYQELEFFDNELGILKKLGRLEGSFKLSSNFKAIKMPLYQGSTLTEAVENGKIVDASMFKEAAQKCEADLEFIHSKGIVHGDYHTGNLMVEIKDSVVNECHLIDFSHSDDLECEPHKTCTEEKMKRFDYEMKVYRAASSLFAEWLHDFKGKPRKEWPMMDFFVQLQKKVHPSLETNGESINMDLNETLSVNVTKSAFEQY